jgi:Holliday junction DNA helicase RuvA
MVSSRARVDPRRDEERAMIHHVEGRLAEKPPGRVIVELGGFGLELHVSDFTWNDAGRPGDRVRLFAHLSVREDAWTLYGFLHEEERALFRLLDGVQGIGPKVAISILSAVPASRLVRVVADGDIAALVAIPGVGKKTASRIVIDLKDKVGAPAAADAEMIVSSAAPATQGDEAVDALVALGYPFASARDAVRVARGRFSEAPIETVVKEALRRL